MSKYLLIIIFIISNIFLYSADKSLVIKSLEKSDNKNFSKNQIYLKTYSPQYFINDFLKSSGLNADFSIEQPFKNYKNKFDKFNSVNPLEFIYLIKFEKNQNIKQICLELNKHSDIVYAAPFYSKELDEYVPNDYDEANQYYLPMINAFEAFEISKGDTNVVIGVVDSGIDINHVDLKDNIFKNYAEIPDDGIDNDNNGFTDDYIGWDFVGDISAADADYDLFEEDNDVIPSESKSTHGTHVAGLVSAVTDNENGIASIGYKLKILPVKCALDDLTKSRKVYKTNESLLYAYSMGVDVINCSWSSSDSYDPVEHDIIKLLYENDVLMVTSAGNSSIDITNNVYPGDYPEVLTVGAIDESGSRAYFTNFGGNVDVFAPGVDIYSLDDNNNYSNKGGTSMSSPIVAGIAGLLKSVNPDLTAEQMKYQIKAASPKSNFQNDKFVNAEYILKYNNPEFPDKNLPGLKLINYKLNDGDSIITGYSNIFSAEFKNVLSYVDNVKYSISSEYLDFNNPMKTIGNTDNLFNFSENFEISEDFPYFKGIADINIDITKNIDNEIDYFVRDRFLYDYHLKTNNKFIELAEIDNKYAMWNFTKISENDVFWGICRIYSQNYIFRYDDSLTNLKLERHQIQDFRLFDDNTIFYSSKSSASDGNVVYFYRVDFQNGEFKETIIYESVNYEIVKFYMFDENHGILILNRFTDNKVVVKEYKNGEFSDIANIPETIETDLASGNRINLYYHKGRIGFYITGIVDDYYSHNIYSDDMMKSWNIISYGNSQGSFKDIAFSGDSAIGYDGNNYYKSTDMGVTWDYVTIENYLHPNLIYSPENSNEFIIVSPDNKILSTNDFGKSWKYIKNYDKKSDGSILPAYSAAAGTFGNKVRVFNLFNDIEYLEYDLKPKSPVYSFELESDDYINLDTILIKNSKSSYIMLKNTGNALLTVDEIYFTNDYNGAYTFRDDKIDFLSAGKSKSMFFDFTPKFEGEYPTEIVINFKETNEDIIINIDAFAMIETSVKEISKNINIYPNPVNNSIFIENNSNEIIYNIQIIDLNGIIKYSSEYNEVIDLEKLTTGTYILKLETSNNIIMKKIIKK